MSTSDKRVAATYQYDPLDRLTDAQGARRFYNNTRLATLIEGERSTCFFEHDTQPLALQRSGTAADTTLLATDAQTSVLTSLPATASPSVHHYTLWPSSRSQWSVRCTGIQRRTPRPADRPLLAGARVSGIQPGADAVQ